MQRLKSQDRSEAARHANGLTPVMPPDPHCPPAGPTSPHDLKFNLVDFIGHGPLTVRVIITSLASIFCSGVPAIRDGRIWIGYGNFDSRAVVQIPLDQKPGDRVYMLCVPETAG